MNICKTCAKVFTKPYVESLRRWSMRLYCSRVCMYPPKVIKNCLECKKEFEVKNYRKDSAHFCSQNCSHKNRDEGKRTEFKKIRQSAEYKKWRTQVFERDGFSCQDCGVKNEIGLGRTVILNADHIKPFAFFPELRFNLSNGKTLCESCHRKTPTFGVGAWRNFNSRVATC